MLYCQNLGVPFSIARCATCSKSVTCKRFQKWYKYHKNEYNAFVLKQVENYPKKYIIKGKVMSTKLPAKKMVIIIDSKTSESEIMEQSKLKELSVAQIKALAGKRILDLGSREHEVVVTIKTKVWDGKLALKKKTRAS